MNALPLPVLLPLTDLVFFAQDGVSALAHLEESAGVQ